MESSGSKIKGRLEQVLEGKENCDNWFPTWIVADGCGGLV
jgi:hypothetical protein